MADPKPLAAPAPQQQLPVEIPANLEAVYSNFAMISHTPSELIIDFARMLPNMPKPRVYSRVVMTPMNAKLFLHALAENLSRYEASFGEIPMPPTNLADQLFKPAKE